MQFFIAGSEKQKKEAPTLGIKPRCFFMKPGLVGEAPVSNKSGLAVVAGSPPEVYQTSICRIRCTAQTLERMGNPP